MVRFTDNSIIIEIETTAPFEHLAAYQQAILKIIQMTRQEGFMNSLDTNLYYLSNLLQAMNFNECQLMALEQVLSNAPSEIKSKFQLRA